MKPLSGHMGNKPLHKELQERRDHVEKRLGKVSVTGRYHRLPKHLADDYDTDSTVLGSGYNGSVFLATDKANKQRCAVKGFKLHGITPTKKDELETECEIFLSLDHPHIARLIDVYEGEDHLDLVMECMEGGELFHRVTQKKRFSEKDAVEASYQMLLAIAYIHSHNIVHRDIKLENFLYDKKDSDHMKLIDFGFSKVWEPNTKMCLSCGTLAYVAPEVLGKSYDSQCDMWSLGVVVFILLVGYMPFSGSEQNQMKHIKAGTATIKDEKWKTVSKEGSEFVGQLLVVDPSKRMNADQALEHKWMRKRSHMIDKGEHLDEGIGNSLMEFAQASQFRRACMSVMAWSLTNEERAEVREAFLEMDKHHHGTISINDFKEVMVNKFHMSCENAQQAFDALDQSHSDEIHYSDFLAAMVSSRIKLHDSLLKQTFRRFDTDGTGYITADNLREILGGTSAEVEHLVHELEDPANHKISYEDFMEYLKSGEAPDHHHAACHAVIDAELQKDHQHADDHKKKGPPRMRMKTKDLLQGDGQGGKGAQGQENTGQKKCCTIL